MLISETTCELVAQCWNDPRTEHLDMIPELAEVFAEKLESVVVGMVVFCSDAGDEK